MTLEHLTMSRAVPATVGDVSLVFLATNVSRCLASASKRKSSMVYFSTAFACVSAELHHISACDVKFDQLIPLITIITTDPKLVDFAVAELHQLDSCFIRSGSHDHSRNSLFHIHSPGDVFLPEFVHRRRLLHEPEHRPSSLGERWASAISELCHHR